MSCDYLINPNDVSDLDLSHIAKSFMINLLFIKIYDTSYSCIFGHNTIMIR